MAAEGQEVSVTKLITVESTGKIIGKGAYGKVIEVRVHGMLCAAKVIHSILIENVTINEFESIKASFLSECAKSSRIVHPNVVQVLGIHYPTPEARLPWLVMELMETSLKLFLDSHKKDEVPLYIKLSILVDVAQGLEFLHGQNVVHRDLSSNNIVLTKHFVAKISDLGTAKFILYGGMRTQTQTPGTLHFMPPEALLVKPRYGKPVDVFSFACITLHLMSHQWPEPKDRVPEGTMVVLTEVQRREEYLQLCNPLPLKELVELCLHNEPKQRPETPTVCKDIKAFKADADHQNPITTAYSFESLSDKIKYFNEKSLVQQTNKLQEQM